MKKQYLVVSIMFLVLCIAGNVTALPLTFEDQVTSFSWGTHNVNFYHSILDNFSLLLDDTLFAEGNNPWSYIYRLKNYDTCMQLDDGILNIALAQNTGSRLSGFHLLHSTLTGAYAGSFTEAGSPRPTPTPEPSSAILFGIGLLVFVGFMRKFAAAS